MKKKARKIFKKFQRRGEENGLWYNYYIITLWLAEGKHNFLF